MYNNKTVQNDLREMVESGIWDFEKLHGKTVLITGATGMLASYFMYELMYLNDEKKTNIKILPLVRNIEKLKNLVDIEREDILPIVQDVCDEITVDGEVDYIVHMASAASPVAITSDPVGVIKANMNGTVNVLELAKEKGAKVLFTSTREIYGGVDDVDRLSEEQMGGLDTLEVRSCYPESKRAAENLCACYAYEYGVKSVIPRLAHVYGPGMALNDGRIMSDLIGSVVEKRDIVLKSAGTAKRAFCYISDAVNALFCVLLNDFKDKCAAVNIANESEEIGISELAEEMVGWFPELGLKVRYEEQENNNQYVKFKRVALDTVKLEGLGWKPVVSLEEGVKRTVEANWERG